MIDTIVLLVAFLLAAVFTAFFAVSLGLTQSAEQKRKNDALSKIPGPDTMPVLGTLANMPRSQQDMLSWFLDKSKEYDGLYMLKFGTLRVVFIGKNEYAAEILKGSKRSEKSLFYQSMHEWLGLGLLTSGGAKWKSRRKLITPAFHFDVLDKTLGTMVKHTSVAIEKFKSFAEREMYVDIWEEFSLLALDIISDSAMGVELEAQLRNPDSLHYVQSRDRVSLLVIERFRTIWLFGNSFYYSITRKGREERRLVKNMHKFTENVILQRWKELQENIEEFRNRKKNSFLDLLLLTKQDSNLSFRDIREEVDTFMFEGHDTTTAAMSFVVQILASFPEVMKRLQKEVDEHFAGLDFSPDNIPAIKRAISNMTYLDAVLKESLRMFPSVPVISREMQEDIELKGYKIPKGSDVLINLFVIHHDENVYKDPGSFKPERWIEKEVPLDEKPFCFIPFSAGARNCIGQRFAMMEERLIIATIAKHFDVTSDTPMSEFRVYGQIVLRSAEKFHIKFTKRTDQLI